MKATIDIPEALYRKVKAKSALLGKPVRQVTVELYQQWLGESAGQVSAGSPESWLDSWLASADAALGAAPPGPTARDILDTDRRRLGSK